MVNNKEFFVIILTIFLYKSVDSISKECLLHHETRITCTCHNNEEFFLPENYNYKNITSLTLTSCKSANLHFSSLTEANKIEEVKVQNISERLFFELFLTTKKLKMLQLRNIGRIPLITHDTFTTISSIDFFEMENVVIDNFEEEFTDIEIQDFVMTNVTIIKIDSINLSGKSRKLKLIDSEFRNVVNTSLNFGFFSNVQIVNSKFELQKPGYLSIESDFTIVKDSVFLNISMNIVATNDIIVNMVCADGKSSLRLSGNRIESFDNKLPTEIVYTRNKMQNETDFFLNQNNTVCIAGNCKCPKSNGQSSHEVNLLILIFGILYSIVILNRI